MNLKDIIPDFFTINHEFECKIRLDKSKTIGWLKTIGAFSNSKGGILFLGVDDKSYDLIGYENTEIDKEKVFFYNEINIHFPYIPCMKMEIIPYTIGDKKRFILQINIFKSQVKPIVIKYQEMPMIFMRRDGFTNPATIEEIRMMFLHSDVVSFDKQITEYMFKQEDFIKLSSFYAERHDGKQITIKELASLGLFNKDMYLTKGGYLFSDKYQGSETKVVCSMYKGIAKGDDTIIASNPFQGNLIDCFHFIWEFLQQRMNHGFIKTSMGRIDKDSYSSRALFEAIINALAHKDYFLQGTQISVDLFKNRLLISSPGSLYNIGEISATYNLDSLISQRRNELICNIFVFCNAMEAKGTGFEKIKEEYKELDQKHQPFIFSKNNQFTIVLPDVTYEEGIRISEDSLKILGTINSESRFDLDILSFCYNNKCDIKEIVKYLDISDSTFFRKEIINNLVDQKYLIEVKESSSKKYYTNKEKVFLN